SERCGIGVLDLSDVVPDMIAVGYKGAAENPERCGICTHDAPPPAVNRLFIFGKTVFILHETLAQLERVITHPAAIAHGNISVRPKTIRQPLNIGVDWIWLKFRY